MFIETEQFRKIISPKIRRLKKSLISTTASLGKKLIGYYYFSLEIVDIDTITLEQQNITRFYLITNDDAKHIYATLTIDRLAYSISIHKKFLSEVTRKADPYKYTTWKTTWVRDQKAHKLDPRRKKTFVENKTCLCCGCFNPQPMRYADYFEFRKKYTPWKAQPQECGTRRTKGCPKPEDRDCIHLTTVKNLATNRTAKKIPPGGVIYCNRCKQHIICSIGTRFFSTINNSLWEMTSDGHKQIQESNQ